MDRSNIARRIVHVSAPLFLVYYFLPSPLWEGGPTRQVALLIALAISLGFELLRLVIGFNVPGMRSYERDQISAGAWAAIALTFAFLFFPFELAAPVIVGMAIVDPVIGKVRRTKWYPGFPYLLHLAIMLTVLGALVPLDLRTVVAAVITSALALLAEGFKTSYVDDDFLMIVVPLIGLALLMNL
jgi:hypothetical protein